ncbi:hypothetical protein FVR03_18140 [Pontibacter qinzhouensis]|uniref:DUF998 domain-containing protein n=1 Tax=Pontibacter qinzhouensis TaxID=2603253 RepID=A0A5C8J9G3_9BACT|nr:hypothetical protein [Pontibacter qinzhouensis]TXK33881.1 hypothetical protein FVR03_18140 [Pontibacter qinzhouensis]
MLEKYMTENAVRVFALLNLGGENIIASWYSSMILLIASGAAILCFSTDNNYYTEARTRLLNFGWLGFSLIFALLSFDEAGSFHENIGDSAVFSMFGHEAGWILFIILIGLVAVYMAGFVLIRVRSVPAALAPALVGILLFASNPIQEEIEINAMQAISADEIWQRPTWLLVAEEGSEIFGSWCLILSMLVYAAKGSSRLTRSDALSTPGISLNFVLSGRPAIVAIGLGLCLLGGLLTAVLLFAGPPEENAGIPENWFTSALAFVAAGLSLYLATRNKRYKWGYLSLCIFCLGLSVMYGTNIYHTFISLLSIRFGTAIMTITFVVLCALTVFVWKAAHHPFTRAGITGWALLFALTIWFSNPYTAEWGFISLSLLVLSLAGAITQTKSGEEIETPIAPKIYAAA